METGVNSPILSHIQLAPPRVEDLPVRRELLDQLHLGLAGKRVVTLIAPTGYGKTALIASWLAELRDRASPWVAAWYSLGEGDNNLRHFLATLISSVHQVYPDALAGLAAAADELPALYPEQLTAELVRGLQALPGRLILVLDGYQVISQADIHNALKTLIRYQPPLLRLVLISQQPLPLDLISLLDDTQSTTLQTADLALRSGEVSRYLAPVADHQATEMLISALAGMPRLSVAELKLAKGLLQHGVDGRCIVNAIRQPGYQQALEQLLELAQASLSAEAHELLERTAPFGLVSCELAEVILGRRCDVDYHRLIEELRSRELFLLPVKAVPGWYRYQTPWQSFMTRNAGARSAVSLSGSGPRTEDTRRAAAWAASHGYLAEALNLWGRTGDTDAMAEAVESRLPRLTENDEWSEVDRLTAGLPAEVINARPQILLAAMWAAYMMLDAARLQQLISDAELIRQQIDPTSPFHAEMDVLCGMRHITHETPTERLHRLRRALESLNVRSRRVRVEALFSLVYITSQGKESDELATYLLQELAQTDDNPRLKARLIEGLGRLYLRVGPVDRLEAVAQSALNFGKELGSRAFDSAARSALGIVAYCRDDAPQAVAQLEAALSGSGLAGNDSIYVVVLYLMQVYAQLGLFDRIEPAMREAQSSMPDIETVSDEEHWEDYWYTVVVAGDVAGTQREWQAVLAYASYLTGDWAGAFAWADAAAPVPPQSAADRRPVILAELRLAQGHYQPIREALAYLDSYLSLLADGYFPRNHSQALTIRARLLWHLGEKSEALKTMTKAIRMGYPLGFRRWFIDGGEASGDMLHALAARGPVATEARALFDQFLQRPPVIIPSHTNMPALEESGLTLREIEIITYLAANLPNKEIAHRLHLSPLTVRNHTAHVYAKLGVKGRAEAVLRAREMGILPPLRRVS